MKKTTFLISVFAIGFGLTANAQFIDQKDVPESVSKGFSSGFSNVAVTNWEKEGSKYRASFTVGKAAHQVTFDDAGKITLNQYTIPADSLSKDVKTGVLKNYPEFTVDSVDRIEEDGKTKYQVALKNEDGGILKVLASDKGMIIKTLTDEDN